MPKIRISTATPLLALHALMTWTRTTTFSTNRKAHYCDVINPPATGLCSSAESYILSPYPLNVLLQSFHLHLRLPHWPTASRFQNFAHLTTALSVTRERHSKLSALCNRLVVKDRSCESFCPTPKLADHL